MAATKKRKKKIERNYVLVFVDLEDDEVEEICHFEDIDTALVAWREHNEDLLVNCVYAVMDAVDFDALEDV